MSIAGEPSSPGRWHHEAVSPDCVAVGRAALMRGHWAEARAAFEKALAVDVSPDALDGLGLARWWLGEPAAAVELRGRAYAALRRARRTADACRVALWLSRELRSCFRRPALADGWLRRAETLAATAASAAPDLHAWLLVARAEAATDVESALELGEQAVAHARRCDAVDAELVALADVGRWHVAAGSVSTGLLEVHEALVAATAGEPADRQCVAEVVCTLLEVSDLLGDRSLLEPWTGLLAGGSAEVGLGPLLPTTSPPTMELMASFCGSCCGGIFLVSGRLDQAEAELGRAVAELARTGAHPRCLHPVATLAELRVTQGRLEEAAELLAGHEDLPEAVLPTAQLALAEGRPLDAVRVIDRGLLRWVDQPVRALPWRALQVEAALAGNLEEVARQAAEALDRTAGLSGSSWHQAHAELAAGRLAAFRGEERATPILHSASRRFAEAGAPLPAARARLELARSLRRTDAGAAVAEARSALSAFDRLGASGDADRADAFLRECGVRGRTGPRDLGMLSRREQQVLELVARGMSNAEIAQRLFISPRTAGHHVSSILTKLDLRTRTEAAAYAVLHAHAQR